MIDRLMIIDYVILAIIGLSMLVGLWRGFLREIISLLSWAAAFIIAFLFVHDAAAWLQPYIPVPSVRTILAFGGLFLATLIIGGLVNMLVGQMVKATGLSGTDRMIGILFGVLRGVVLVALLLTAVSFTPVPDDPWWQSSVLVPYFEPLVQWLRDLLPPEIMDYFDSVPDNAEVQSPAGN